MFFLISIVPGQEGEHRLAILFLNSCRAFPLRPTGESKKHLWKKKLASEMVLFIELAAAEERSWLAVPRAKLAPEGMISQGFRIGPFWTYRTCVIGAINLCLTSEIRSGLDCTRSAPFACAQQRPAQSKWRPSRATEPYFLTRDPQASFQPTPFLHPRSAAPAPRILFVSCDKLHDGGVVALPVK